MARLAHAWGKVLEAFALAACALLGAMALMICADVLLRNAALIPGVDGSVAAWPSGIRTPGVLDRELDVAT